MQPRSIGFPQVSPLAAPVTFVIRGVERLRLPNLVRGLQGLEGPFKGLIGISFVSFALYHKRALGGSTRVQNLCGSSTKILPIRQTQFGENLVGPKLPVFDVSRLARNSALRFKLSAQSNFVTLALAKKGTHATSPIP